MWKTKFSAWSKFSIVNVLFIIVLITLKTMNCSLYCTPPFLAMIYCLYFLQVICHLYPFLSIFVGAFHIPNFMFSIIACHQWCISMLPIMLSMVHGGGYRHVHNKYPNIVWKGLQYSQAWSQLCMEECITMFMIGIMTICWRRIIMFMIMMSIVCGELQ